MIFIYLILGYLGVGVLFTIFCRVKMGRFEFIRILLWAPILFIAVLFGLRDK